MKKNILIVLTATAGLLASCVQTNEDAAIHMEVCGRRYDVYPFSL